MDKERMDGRVIVITGASSGMGAAMAKDFSKRGAKIAIDRKSTRLNSSHRL